MMRVCLNCKYFDVCGDVDRTEPCKGREEIEITKAQAAEFYRDLCGTVYGDSNKVCQGVMSVALIADYMQITIERANDFCNAMIKYGITERQSGMIVV